MSGLCDTAVRASFLGRLQEIRKGESRNTLSIFLTHFNYFIVQLNDAPFLAGHSTKSSKKCQKSIDLSPVE